MRIRESIFILLLLCIGLQASGQNLTRQQYIEKYRDEAVKQMHKHKIPASITLAQACLESSNGNSELARKANNHFGIKCHNGGKGKGYLHDDDRKGECFRHYKNAGDSFTDHSYFLISGSRYNSLFDLKITDYKAWAHGLKAAGYATNPRYAQMLIEIIEEY
ncbi:MAG: glucosaminidase domain-containing protein, partial [Bacteroidales bacterium]|nr:glucosaminidase domain-containing protein [Bacteroidales bacterium]